MNDLGFSRSYAFLRSPSLPFFNLDLKISLYNAKSTFINFRYGSKL